MSEHRVALDLLRQVIDPEVGINIVDLGLVVSVEDRPGSLWLRFSPTSAACPMTELLADAIEAALQPLLCDARTLDIELVFDPPWTPERMSEAARQQLGWA
jgi:metal-sulfur cluster biosynthetic enzyme